MFKFTYANAIYTGGGIYIYCGQTHNGSYFFTADDFTDCILFLDTDPEADLDAALMPEWQNAHTITMWTGHTAVAFSRDMFNHILEGISQGRYNVLSCDMNVRLLNLDKEAHHA